MSEQDEGFGGNAGPTLEYESDFANEFSNVSATGDQSWGANPHHSHRSEDPLMSSGSGKPAQPAMGQRSIFGTGRGPVFGQMPTYKPVTRGPDAPEPRAPQPPRQDFGGYAGQGATQPRPVSNPERRSGYSQPQSFPGQNNDRRAAQDYGNQDYATQDFSTQDLPAQDYGHQSFPSQDYASPAQGYPPQTRARPAAPNMPPAAPPQPGWGHQPSPAPRRPAPQPHSLQPAATPTPANQDRFPDRIFPEPAAPSPAPGTRFGDQSFGDASFPDANFADAGFDDASFPDTSFQGGHQETGYQEPAYQEPGYQEPSYQDASFEDASFPEDPAADAEFGTSDGLAFEEAEPLHLGARDAAFDVDQDYDAVAEQGADGYQPHADHHGASQGYAAIPSSQALQSFDAVYDQPPQIPLGATSSPGMAEGFYETEQPDADFLDDGQFQPGMESVQPQPGRKLGLRSRSMFMVGSALLGAVALGGALAFAYKQSGGSMSSGETPVVQADTRPVKEAPQNAGGKELPHKNKLIYERLQNGDQPEAERIVPRQEELAMPAMPGAAPVGAPPAVATVDDPDGGPRRVKTLVVRPDGSVMPPPAAAPAPAPAPAQQQLAAVAPAPQAAPPAPPPAPAAAAPAPAADPQPVAAIPPPKPKPAPTPAPAAPTKYVVQVGSKQNQTDALATFADMQQKYPTLLASYRPMVQKANLGAKGIWYRLRIGPIADKSAASKLCSQLKSQGHPDCLVMAAQ
jgi:cell division protein FtsN